MIERFGGVAQLGERTVRIRKVKGSNPSVSTTSEQALYRLLRLFLQKSSRIHSVAPSLQTEPAALGFDLVLGVVLKAAASILMRCSNQKATTKSWLFDWNFCQPCIHDGKMPASVTLEVLQVPGKDSGRGIPHIGG